jgi:enoyl-[acyl-carrier-protein] reductase (NADH)
VAKAPGRRAVTVDDVARQVVGFISDPVVTGNIRTVDAGLFLV